MGVYYIAIDPTNFCVIKTAYKKKDARESGCKDGEWSGGKWLERLKDAAIISVP
jgi:hypothetical protein